MAAHRQRLDPWLGGDRVDTSPRITRTALTEGLNRQWHRRRACTNKSVGSWLCRTPSAHVAGVSLALAFCISDSRWSAATRSSYRSTDGAFGANVYEMALMTSEGVFLFAYLFLIKWSSFFFIKSLWALLAQF